MIYISRKQRKSLRYGLKSSHKDLNGNNIMDHQGKRPDQVESSYKIMITCFILTIVLGLAMGAYQLIKFLASLNI